MDAAAVEKAVDEALTAGNVAEASRLAAGHPDPATHLSLMQRINEQMQTTAPAPLVPPAANADAPVRTFQLEKQPAQLVAFNIRKEFGDDEGTPAGDLKFKVNLPSTVLDDFDSTLRGMFFCKANSRVQDLADQSHEAPNLRAVKLKGPFKWGARYAGYTLALHYGVSSKKPHVLLKDCQMNKVELDPQEGGTVIVGFRVQFHPDEASAGKLAMLVNTQVDVSLTPPEGGGEIVSTDEDEE
jgi:hypothetical protein